MLYELDQPAFVEIVEKASDVSVHNVVHFLLQECVPTPPIPLSTLRWVPRGSSARLEAERFANPFS
jgi:hypothetical protein